MPSERNGGSQQYDVRHCAEPGFLGYFVYIQHNFMRKLVDFRHQHMLFGIVGMLINGVSLVTSHPSGLRDSGGSAVHRFQRDKWYHICLKESNRRQWGGRWCEDSTEHLRHAGSCHALPPVSYTDLLSALLYRSLWRWTKFLCPPTPANIMSFFMIYLLFFFTW